MTDLKHGMWVWVCVWEDDRRQAFSIHTHTHTPAAAPTHTRTHPSPHPQTRTHSTDHHQQHVAAEGQCHCNAKALCAAPDMRVFGPWPSVCAPRWPLVATLVNASRAPEASLRTYSHVICLVTQPKLMALKLAAITDKCPSVNKGRPPPPHPKTLWVRVSMIWIWHRSGLHTGRSFITARVFCHRHPQGAGRRKIPSTTVAFFFGGLPPEGEGGRKKFCAKIVSGAKKTEIC